jgi:tetratricopeptide (TPR) repeat protein
MRFLAKLSFALRGVKDFRRASKLAYLGRDQEALAAFEQYKGPAESLAKAHLTSANILYRMKRYDEAVNRYTSFLSSHVASIDDPSAQEYLRLYALFFQERALHKSTLGGPLTISAAYLQSLAAKAPWLERKEFPPP